MDKKSSTSFFNVLFALCLILLAINGFSQDPKKDNRNPSEKEDSANKYNSENISTLDLLTALKIAGIGIHKFYIGEFDKKYKLVISLNEYKSGKKISTKTILDFDNEYVFWDEKGNMLFDFIDQIKILTKEEGDSVVFEFITYSLGKQEILKFKKDDPIQTFFWRSYSSTKWQLNKEIPLLTYMSSWYDERTKGYRFCGVVDLSLNSESTKKLLNSSPHYFVISYYVEEFKISLSSLLSDGMSVADIALLCQKEQEKGSDKSKYNISESELNNLGYYLMRKKKMKDALVIFKLNTEFYPEAANTYDSLGECLLALNKIEEGLAAYKKSLKLNPENKVAATILKQHNK